MTDTLNNNEILNELDGASYEEPKYREESFFETEKPVFIKEPVAFPLEVLEGLEIRNVIVAISRLADANVEIAFHSVLAAMNLICSLNNKVIMNWRGSREAKPLSLFLVTLAQSGARKSTMDDMALRGIRKVERRLFEQYKEVLKPQYDLLARKYSRALYYCEEGLVKPTEPKMPTLIASDPTIEGLLKIFGTGRDALGLFSDEAGGFLCGRAGQEERRVHTMASLCKFYDGNPVTQNHATKELKQINYASLTLHLMLQPDRTNRQTDIANLYGKENESQGILSRILPIRPLSLKGKISKAVNDEKSIRAFNKCIDEYCDRCVNKINYALSSGFREVYFDRESIQMIRDFSHYFKLESGTEGLYGDYDSYLNKIIDNLSRMAATFAAWDDTTIVTKRYAEKAFFLFDYYVDSIKDILAKGRYQKLITYKDFLDNVKGKAFDLNYLQEKRPRWDKTDLMAMVRDMLEYKWILPLGIGTDASNPQWGINPRLNEAFEDWKQTSLKRYIEGLELIV